MLIKSKSGRIAVWKWGGKWFDPIAPDGFTEWITDNPWAIPFIKSVPNTECESEQKYGN